MPASAIAFAQGMSTTRGAETPIALDPDGVPIVVDGVLAEDSAAADASESCVICVSRPRAVRFLPCGHASLCQLCTIQEMQRSGQCPVARCSVVQLVAVPVASTDPLSVRRMQTHQDAPEPEQSLKEAPSRASRPSCTGQLDQCFQHGAKGYKFFF